MVSRLTGEEPLFLVMNTGSGSGDAEETQATISHILDEANRRYQLMAVDDGNQLIQTAEEAVELARQQQGIVVAVGGDGTLNAVSQVVLGSGVPFAILPQGTFNYFGRSYGIPQDTERATRCLLDAKIEHISVGTLNGKVFLVNASLGLYPELLEERETYKQRYGRSRLVALWSALVTLLHAHRQLNVQFEYQGKVHHQRTPTLVVGNNALQLEHIGIDEADEIERHHLVAMMPEPVGTLALYGLLIRGLFSRLGKAQNVTSFGFQSMTVRLEGSKRLVKVAMDGEISRLQQPLEFKVSEHRLALLVPQDDSLRERA